jgi:hypothetical protein
VRYFGLRALANMAGVAPVESLRARVHVRYRCSIKQANEFGIIRGGQKIIGLLTYISDVHGMGLRNAKGLILASAFSWDLTDETRAWTREKPFHDVSRATAHAKKQSGFCSSPARVPTQSSLNLSECLEIVGGNENDGG